MTDTIQGIGTFATDKNDCVNNAEIEIFEVTHHYMEKGEEKDLNNVVVAYIYKNDNKKKLQFDDGTPIYFRTYDEAIGWLIDVHKQLNCYEKREVININGGFHIDIYYTRGEQSIVDSYDVIEERL